jgi:hypothetical protein
MRDIRQLSSFGIVSVGLLEPIAGEKGSANQCKFVARGK